MYVCVNDNSLYQQNFRLSNVECSLIVAFIESWMQQCLGNGQKEKDSLKKKVKKDGTSNLEKQR